MNYVPIIDTGHGYNTPGKRSDGFYYSNGKVMLKENSFNEAIGNKLSMLFYLNNKQHYFITNEWYDVPLSERCQRENVIHKQLKQNGKKSIFISLHADAYRIKNAATGGRFYYRSESGKKIAEFLTNYLRNNGYQLSLREPKYANFKVLRSTASPAVLFEAGFMTTKSDLDKLLSDDFRNHTASLLYKALIELQ